MDESVQDISSLLEVHMTGLADIINIKISKIGGLFRAKQAVDLCASLEMPMIIDDAWGGDVVTAASAHLASTVPDRLHFATTDLNAYNTVKTGMLFRPKFFRFAH